MKIRIALCALAPLVLVAAACGGDDDDSEATPATEAAAEEPAGEEPAAEEPAGEEPAAAEPAASGSATDSALWANVPEVPNATEADVRTIHEGGVQAYGTIEESRENIVPAYTELLENNGWTVESSGGDAGGDFGGCVQATYEDGRYLSLGFGGPPEGTVLKELDEAPTAATLRGWIPPRLTVMLSNEIADLDHWLSNRLPSEQLDDLKARGRLMTPHELQALGQDAVATHLRPDP